MNLKQLNSILEFTKCKRCNGCGNYEEPGRLVYICFHCRGSGFLYTRRNIERLFNNYEKQHLHEYQGF